MEQVGSSGLTWRRIQGINRGMLGMEGPPMRIIRLHKRPTPELGTAEGCVKGLLESSTGQDNCKSLKSAWMVGRQGLNSHPRDSCRASSYSTLCAFGKQVFSERRLRRISRLRGSFA